MLTLADFVLNSNRFGDTTSFARRGGNETCHALLFGLEMEQNLAHTGTD